MADRPSITGVPRWAKIALIVAGGIVALVLLLDKIVMPSLVHSQSVVIVPAVVGRPAGEAARDFAARGFVIAKIDTHPDEHFPAGTVLFQNPYGGAEVKEGRKVFLIVSSGKELLAIPNLTGLPLREAKIRLQMAGLTLGDVAYEYNAAVPEETVLRQSPASPARIAMGAAVALTVSNGPAEQNVAVPSLVGLTLAEAQARLLSVKLVFGQITYRSNRTLPSTVLEQRPAAGDTVKTGSPVHLVVSTD